MESWWTGLPPESDQWLYHLHYQSTKCIKIIRLFKFENVQVKKRGKIVIIFVIIINLSITLMGDKKTICSINIPTCFAVMKV